MRLSNDPVAPGGRESGPRGIGEVGKLLVTGGVTSRVAERWPSLDLEHWDVRESGDDGYG